MAGEVWPLERVQAVAEGQLAGGRGKDVFVAKDHELSEGVLG